MYRIMLWLLISFCLSACDETPDEAQIALNISAMQAAIESRNFTGIKDYLHADFLANERLSAREVNQLLRLYSAQHAKLGVTILQSRTAMDPAFTDRAETTLSVVVTGSSGRLPSDGSVRSVKIAWIKVSGDWLVIKADWEQYKGSRAY